MSNAIFDQGSAAPYTGRLAICPICACAVAAARKQIHLDELHPEPDEHELAEASKPVAEIVAWDDDDPTA